MDEYPAALGRAILTSMTEGLIIGDLNGNILDANAAALRLHGFGSVEEARRPLHEFHGVLEICMPGGQAVEIDDWPLARAMREEVFTGYELIVRRPDSGQQWRNIYSGTPVRDADGSLVRTVITMHDVSAEREMQRLILEKDRALREEQEKLRLVVDGARDYAIFMVDAQGRIATWNEGAERLKQWSADEIIGQPLDLLYTEEDRRRGWAAENLRQAREHGSYHEEHIRRRKDGTYFEADVDIHAIYAEDGALRGYSKVVHDITDRIAVMRENERLAKELRLANVRQWSFLSDVLRNVSEGKLRLCRTADELPSAFERCTTPIPITREAGMSELRQSARKAAVERDFDDARWQDLITAASEAAMNAIVHAGGGRGRICGNHHRVQVWIEDKGRGITVDSLPNATLGKGFTTAGTLGQGMKLMLQTVDRLYLLTNSSGTTVVLEQDRVPDVPPWLLPF